MGLFIGKKQAVAVWLCASFFYLYEIILRVAPGVMAHSLMDAFGVNATSLGLLTSIYYYAYVPMQIPCGILVDKLGPRLIISISCLVCSMGAFLFAHAESLWAAQVARFMLGAGSACAFISCLKLSVEWFSVRQFAVFAGLTNMLGTLGGCFAGAPLARFVNTFGWREATTILAYVGFALTVVCIIVIRNRPAVRMATDEGCKDKVSCRSALKVLLKSPQVILIGMVGGFMYLPISAFSELWAVPFLMRTFAIANDTAAYGAMMVFLGAAIGGPILARYSIRKGSSLSVMKVSAIYTGALFAVAAMAQYLTFNGVLVVLFTAGVMSSGQVLCFTLVKERTQNEISGTAMAFTNALVSLSSIIFQPLMGKILDWGWTGMLDEAGVRVYSLEAYRNAIFSIPVFLLISWVLLFFVRERRKFAEPRPVPRPAETAASLERI